MSSGDSRIRRRHTTSVVTKRPSGLFFTNFVTFTCHLLLPRAHLLSLLLLQCLFMLSELSVFFFSTSMLYVMHLLICLSIEIESQYVVQGDLELVILLPLLLKCRHYGSVLAYLTYITPLYHTVFMMCLSSRGVTLCHC